MSNSKGKIIVYDEKGNELQSILINSKSTRTINNLLILAVEQENPAMVKLALDLGADVNYKDNHAILEAIENSNIEIVKLLLRRGADPNAKEWNNRKYKTCFEIAFNLQSYDMLNLLLKYKANMKYENKNPLIQMAYDCYDYDEDIMNLLVENGADVDEAFKTCIDMCSSKRFVCFLIDKGADVTFLDNEPLIKYIKNNSYIIVEKLIAAGADVNARGGVPLEEAIKCSTLRMVHILVENGAKVQDKHLTLACRNNQSEIVNYFISKNLKLDYDKALIEACKYGLNGLIDRLISIGANAGAYDNAALSEILARDANIIIKLIAAGAETDLSKINLDKII